MAIRLGSQVRMQEVVTSVFPDRLLDGHLTRQQQLARALWLVSASVTFGLVSGSISLVTGLHGHSLGVFAVGLGVLADVIGSATLIWRFRAERHRPGQSAVQVTAPLAASGPPPACWLLLLSH